MGPYEEYFVPNLPVHINFAYQTVKRMGHPAVDPYIGYYLLGSTSPDIKSITHASREQYHFAPLSFKYIGTGTKTLFQNHPELQSTVKCNGPTRAFIAGYITHLVLDESWITEMFRPYFGNPRVFPNNILGKVMDRALQLELDRQSYESMKSTLPLLPQVTDDIKIEFISNFTLSQWNEWVKTFLKREFTWERLRFMAQRISSKDSKHPAHKFANDFLMNMPNSLSQIFDYVSHDDLARFKKETAKRLTHAVEDYLQ